MSRLNLERLTALVPLDKLEVAAAFAEISLRGDKLQMVGAVSVHGACPVSCPSCGGLELAKIRLSGGVVAAWSFGPESLACVSCGHIVRIYVRCPFCRKEEHRLSTDSGMFPCTCGRVLTLRGVRIERIPTDNLWWR